MASHSAAEHADPNHVDGLGHHIGSVQTYVAVFGSLLLFTALTYGVSFADLGAFAFPIAMLVAFVKAGLVATFFMHLKYDEKFNVLIFVSSIFFVGIFFGFTLMDLMTRGSVTETEAYRTYYIDNNIGFGPQHAEAAAPAAGDAPAAEASGEAAH
jgi:cytochrome c oxidase subunit 4